MLPQKQGEKIVNFKEKVLKISIKKISFKIERIL